MESEDITSAALIEAWKALCVSLDLGADQGILLDKFPHRPGKDERIRAAGGFTPRHFFPPPPQRAALKKPSASPSSQRHRRVSFRPSVGVRTSLEPPPALRDVWYTAEEIRSMKAASREKRAPLRHSTEMSGQESGRLRRILSSPPPGGGLRASLTRGHSVRAELSCDPPADPSPEDIRYNALVAEIDREVYISNGDRRESARRRLHHYCRMWGELDRQGEEGYTRINVSELARASRRASGEALARALERSRDEATVAQAILLHVAREEPG